MKTGFLAALCAMRFDRLRTLSVVALGLSVTTSACSQPVVDDGTDNATGAATTGGRWTSPLEPGKYDAQGVTLRVAPYRDRQGIQVFSQAGAKSLSPCEGPADVVSGKVRVEDADHGCKLELVPADGGGVKMTGVLDGRSVSLELQRRPRNTLVGTYSTADGGGKLAVTKSSEDALTFNLTYYSNILVQAAVGKDEALTGDWLLGPPDLYESFKAEVAPHCELNLHVMLVGSNYGFSGVLGESTGCDQNLVAFGDLTFWSSKSATK